MLEADEKHIVHGWIADYSDTLYNYLCNRVADQNAAKDILQETFIAAWKNSQSFKSKSNEKTWLFAILKNKLIDHYRSHARPRQIIGLDYFFDAADHWTEQAAPQNWSSTEDILDKKEFHSVLRNCNNKLTLLQQQVFSMKYLDDLDADHICKVLKITSSNYWVLIHRSKLELQACLTKNWFCKK